MNTSPSAASLVAVPDSDLDRVASCDLPTPWATFRMHVFVEPLTGKEHLALTLGDVADGKPVLSRIHSECLTGDSLFSLRCDCGPQLEAALRMIVEEGCGALFYLRQEGRGIGLVNKIRAYQLQDAGADTVEANEQLGFKADQRNYCLCLTMLQHLGISTLRLMTNNPSKIAAMEQISIQIAERVPLIISRNPHNERYLTTKAVKLGHLF